MKQKAVRLIIHAIVCGMIFLGSAAIDADAAATLDYDRIEKALNSTDWETRLAAVEELNKVRNERSLKLLMQVADTSVEYWPVKIRAILILGEIGDYRAVDILLSVFNDNFLHHECPAIKSYTAVALGNFKERRVVDALVTGISHGEIYTREASINSLGKIGDPRAVPALLPMLNDSSFAIRFSTIKALESIKDLSAVAHLQRIASGDKDQVIRESALSAARAIKPGCC